MGHSSTLRSDVARCDQLEEASTTPKLPADGYRVPRDRANLLGSRAASIVRSCFVRGHNGTRPQCSARWA